MKYSSHFLYIPTPLRVYFGGHLFDQIARSSPQRYTQITTLDKVPFDTAELMVGSFVGLDILIKPRDPTGDRALRVLRKRFQAGQD